MAKRIALMVAAGTGGHLYPAIAAARSVIKQGQQMANDPGWDVVFAVRRGDLGKVLLEREGFQVAELTGQGLPRQLSWRFLTFPLKVLAGFVQAWRLLGNLRPRIVVGMGGSLSFVVLAAARLRGIRTLIHEQNVLPGLANRLIGRFVNSVAVSFPESESSFTNKGVWLCGLPVRTEIGRVHAAQGRQHFGLDEQRITFLVFGGSLGAHRLNGAVLDTWRRLEQQATPFQVLHITGLQEYTPVQQAYHAMAVKAVVMPYCHDMAAAYGAADLVICRSGASTLVELMVAHRPAILIPYPYASANHQLYNAEVLLKRGVAELIPDAELTAETLARTLEPYLRNPVALREKKERFAMMALDSSHVLAAEHLADYITAIP